MSVCKRLVGVVLLLMLAGPGLAQKVAPGGKPVKGEKDATIDRALAEARAHVKAGRHEAAVRCFDAVLKLAPGNTEAQKGKAESQKALEAARRLQSYQAAMARGQQLLNVRRFADAGKAFEEALKLKPDDAAARGGLEAVAAQTRAAYTANVQNGLVLLGQKRYVEAARAFEMALQVKPEDKPALGGKKLAEEAQAELVYTTAVNQARAAVKASRFDDAVRAFEAALKVRPEDKKLAAERDEAAKKARAAREEAARKAEAAKREAEKREEAYTAALTKGLTSLGEKKYAEAVKAFEEALKARPNDAAALNGKRFAEEAIKAAGTTPRPRGR